MNNILTEELVKNEENIKDFINNWQSSIESNIDIQNKYKVFISNYIMQLVDLNTNDFSRNDNDTLINLLYKLQKILPTINELLVHLNTIKNNISKLTLPYNLDNINSLFLEYLDLQNKIALKNSELLDFLNFTSKFITFNFLTTNEEKQDDSLVELSANENTVINSSSSDTNTLQKDIKEIFKDNISVEPKESQFVENTLLISSTKQIVVLPYTINELNSVLKEQTKYSNYNEVIQNLYTIPYANYKNAVIARFREAFNLVRNREHKSIKEAFDLGIELLFNYNLHPDIISACKTTDELDIYLDYLETNETDKFDIFNIKYEVPPTLVKK